MQVGQWRILIKRYRSLIRWLSSTPNPSRKIMYIHIIIIILRLVQGICLLLANFQILFVLKISHYSLIFKSRLFLAPKVFINSCVSYLRERLQDSCPAILCQNRRNGFFSLFSFPQTRLKYFVGNAIENYRTHFQRLKKKKIFLAHIPGRLTLKKFTRQNFIQFFQPFVVQCHRYMIWLIYRSFSHYCDKI